MEKSVLHDGFARTAQALASGRRCELLDLLTQAERSVEDLAGTLAMTVANCSQHLQVLFRAGLVASRREGNRVLYRVASDSVVRLLATLQEVSFDRSAQVRKTAEEYLGGPVTAIDRTELAERIVRGDVVVIDVRPLPEYRAGHLPDARSIPIDELEARLEELPGEVEVVAYCRGRFCAFAGQAVRILRASGRRARRLEDGVREWQQAGLALEVAS